MIRQSATLSPGDFPNVLSVRIINGTACVFMGWHHIGRFDSLGTYVATDTVPLGPKQKEWIETEGYRIASEGC